ncbi:unnamed protein product [Closterium sp. Naga37s-1]|nr:unnamed protein product [Closterium sp. Naga37s-1]
MNLNSSTVMLLFTLQGGTRIAWAEGEVELELPEAPEGSEGSDGTVFRPSASVMESPERVRRVTPPSTTSAHTYAAHTISHPPTALSAAAPPATSACAPASAAADVADGNEVGAVDAAAGVGAGLAAGDVAESADVAEEVWSVRITLAGDEREGEADDWSAAEIVKYILGGMLLVARMCGLLMLPICCIA